MLAKTRTERKIKKARSENYRSGPLSGGNLEIFFFYLEIFFLYCGCRLSSITTLPPLSTVTTR